MPGKPSPRALQLLTIPLDTLWHLCTAPLTPALLALLAAATFALGLALPQAPWRLVGDPQALKLWLADLQVQQGAWAGWAGRTGLLSFYATPGFRLLWAVVGLAALVVTADRAARAWREAPAGPRPWYLLAHLGLLLLLVGAPIEERWGWEGEYLLLGSGSAVAAGSPRDPLRIERLSDQATPASVGLHWQRGQQQGQATVRPGSPLLVGLQTIHLQQSGSAVQLHVIDGSGQAVLLDDPAAGSRPQTMVALRFGKAGESRYVAVPARDWMVRVSFQPTALGGSPLALWVYRGLDPTPLAQAALEPDGELAIAGTRLLWQVVPYADVRLAVHPGLAFWIAGWLLLCLGLALGLAREGWAWPRWLGLAAALALGGAGWWALGGPALARAAPPTLAGLVAAAALLLVALGAAILLVGALAALAALPQQPATPSPARPAVLGWGLLAFSAGGSLSILARWAAEGTLWPFAPGQAWWALTCCLLAGAWHLPVRGRRWMLPAGLVVASLLATFSLLMLPRSGFVAAM